jgi:hypothetical protein
MHLYLPHKQGLHPWPAMAKMHTCMLGCALLHLLKGLRSNKDQARYLDGRHFPKEIVHLLVLLVGGSLWGWGWGLDVPPLRGSPRSIESLPHAQPEDAMSAQSKLKDEHVKSLTCSTSCLVGSSTLP